MGRSHKEQFVDELRGIFSSSVAGILIDYQGLTAQDVVELRQKLRGADASMKVLKNTLARLAVKDTSFANLSDEFVKTRAFIYSKTDPVGQAGILCDFIKNNPKLVIHAGVLADKGKTVYLAEPEIQKLAKMPSKEDIMVKILFLLKSPASSFVRTLNEVSLKLVRVLSAVAEKKQINT